MAGDDPSRKRLPTTLLLGLGTILVAEALLVVDLWMRGWATMPPALEPPPPEGFWAVFGRWVAVNITPICWVGLLLLLDGLLELTRFGAADGSPARRRPRRFLVCFLASVVIWLFFDWVNFRFIDAWQYHGLPGHIVHRYTGYFFAFGAIVPAMLLTAEVYQRLGLRRCRGGGLRIGPRVQRVLFMVGVGLIALPFVVRKPVATFGLWLGIIFLLEPLNLRLAARLGRSSMRGAEHDGTLIGDWQAGRWGRTLALLAAGLTCGFLWEFWNYWAAAKWTYDLPFLGALEKYRLFEMPLIGYSGFPPFALECWVAFQTIALALGNLTGRRRLIEPLPDEDALL
ncbi:MAG: hypothetical protein ACYSTY_03785 [Planctomycetota bacterium]|jgi:hypothetical protein